MQYSKRFAKALLIAACAAAATFGATQTWTETVYHLHDKHFHTADEYNVWSGNGSYISVEAIFIGRFKVTGSESSAPNWRAHFASICDNALPYADEWEGPLESTNELVNWVSYYFRGPHEMETCSRHGQSGHAAGDCGFTSNVNTFTDGTTTHTRYMEERVCEDMWFSIRAKQTGGGQGGS